MFALDERNSSLTAWCSTSGIQNYNDRNPDNQVESNTPISQVYDLTEKQLNGTNDFGTPYGEISVLDQCVTEQKYVRGSMSRAALYLQVSISGQALVFVVRTTAFSWISRAGLWTYVAFIAAQFCATLIAVFGFNGYTNPPNPIEDCQFCTLSSGGNNPFFSSREVPIYGTEPVFTASVIGCTYYVIAAWIWSAIWSFGLDPIKWLMHYILNEEGIRDQSLYLTFFNKQGEHIGANVGIGVNRSSMSRVSVARLSGRISAGGYASGGVPGVGGQINAPGSLLSRASVVRVSK
jgi:H+-transporting ATPase